jgi:hypothetical protein
LLERIALHQTRLHTPGLGLDAKGVALGAKGLVLLPSVDRLVALLSVYTRERSLDDMMPTLRIVVVRSKLGIHEIVLEFAAESSERMDRVAETARLAGGLTFTGTSRHFVQYRDAAAPFGYDAADLVATPAPLALYHDRFSQTYETERTIELRTLLLRLMLRSDPNTTLEPGMRWLVAEPGIGPALANYLVRSGVEGDACVAEWPPESAFIDVPTRRWVIRVPDLPARMRPLLHTTPGMISFVPAGPGVAVEAGFRHPIELRACPLFDTGGLVLWRGRGEEPWTLDRLPILGALTSLCRVELRQAGADALRASAAPEPDSLRVPLRVVRSGTRRGRVRATFISRTQLPLLRRLSYALPHATLTQVRIALTAGGAFLTSAEGIEAVPLGTFYSEIHPRLYLLAGHDLAPAIAPEALAHAIGAPASHLLFVGPDATSVAVEESAFVSLESALLEAPPWEPVVAEAIAHALDDALVDLKTTSIGMMPLRGVGPPPESAKSTDRPDALDEP